MDDAKLIFVSLYFQFCLSAEAAMVVCFSLVIKGIKERLACFQGYYNLLFSGSLSVSRRFLYTKQSVLVLI